MISDQHKDALAAIKELKGEKIGASMVLELVDLVENLDANLEALAAKATDIARTADLVAQERNALRTQVSEWLCINCNTVYPGPPTKGLACCSCEKCGGTTVPRGTHELRELSAAYRRQRDELETANANLAHYQSALCMPGAPEEYQVQHGGVVPEISPVRVAELVDQLAVIHAESAAMDIPDGWALNSADFSILANGGNRPWVVTLIRTGEDRVNWSRFADADQIELYAYGRGKSYSEALIEAIKAARAAAPVPKGGA